MKYTNSYFCPVCGKTIIRQDTKRRIRSMCKDTAGWIYRVTNNGILFSRIREWWREDGVLVRIISVVIGILLAYLIFGMMR